MEVEHVGASESQWRDGGVRIVHSDQLDSNTPQTPGMTRAAAINRAMAGANRLWAGTVSVHPNARPRRTITANWKASSISSAAEPGCVGVRTRVFRGGWSGGFYLRAAVRPASGNQRQSQRAADVRGRAQRSGTRRGKSGYPDGGDAEEVLWVDLAHPASKS